MATLDVLQGYTTTLGAGAGCNPYIANYVTCATGNTLVVILQEYYVSHITPTITDTGNTWLTAGSVNPDWQAWYATNITGGAPRIVQVFCDADRVASLTIFEIEGNGQTLSIEAEDLSGAVSVSTYAGASMTIAVGAAIVGLIYTRYQPSVTSTVPTGWTDWGNTTDNYHFNVHASSKTVSSGTYSASGNLSTTADFWINHFLAIRVTPAVGGTPVGGALIVPQARKRASYF